MKTLGRTINLYPERSRRLKSLENVQVHEVKIKSKDPFVILKIICCLLIFNDF